MKEIVSEIFIPLDELEIESLYHTDKPPKSHEIIELLNDFDFLHRVSLDEIRGKFLEPEIRLIADVYHGLMYLPMKHPAQQLLITVIDAIELDKLDEKWAIDSQLLYIKLFELTQFQAYSVILAMEKCWKLSEKENTSLDELLRVVFQGKPTTKCKFIISLYAARNALINGNIVMD